MHHHPEPPPAASPEMQAKLREVHERLCREYQCPIS